MTTTNLFNSNTNRFLDIAREEVLNGMTRQNRGITVRVFNSVQDATISAYGQPRVEDLFRGEGALSIRPRSQHG